MKVIKDNIQEIDGVDIYFLSEQNELALIQNKYTKKEKIFNPSNEEFEILKRDIEKIKIKCDKISFSS